MTEVATLQKLSERVSWLGGIIGVLFVLSVIDTIASGFLTPKNSFSVVAGTSLWVNGNLPLPVKDLEALNYQVPSPGIHIVFKQVQGRMWRGLLEVAPEAQPGQFSLVVSARSLPEESTPPVYHVHVFDTAAALRQSYPSWIRRYLGIRPLFMILATLPLVTACLAASFYLSSRMEALLAQKGIVAIAKMARTKQGWEIHFALGRNGGIAVNDHLQLLDPAFRPIGQITVAQVLDTHSIATVALTTKITPDCWIAPQ